MIHNSSVSLFETCTSGQEALPLEAFKFTIAASVIIVKDYAEMNNNAAKGVRNNIYHCCANRIGV